MNCALITEVGDHDDTHYFKALILIYEFKHKQDLLTRFHRVPHDVQNESTIYNIIQEFDAVKVEIKKLVLSLGNWWVSCSCEWHKPPANIFYAYKIVIGCDCFSRKLQRKRFIVLHEPQISGINLKK